MNRTLLNLLFCLLVMVGTSVITFGGQASDNLLKNTAFGMRDGALVDWTDRTHPPQKLSVMDESGQPVLRVNIEKEGGGRLGEIMQVVEVKSDTRYRLQGRLKGDAPGIALLQIKRIGDGKEISRDDIAWNKGGWTDADKTFDSRNADHIMVVCRFRQRAEDVGKSVYFSSLSLTEAGQLRYQGPETGPTAVPTFECVGLYWKPTGGGPDRACSVRYRLRGELDWRDAMPMWFDSNDHDSLPEYSLEYRGSIVNLQPGKTYDVELSLAGTDIKRTLTFSTWSDDFKIARRVELPARQPDQTFVITDGGNATDGYVLYAPPKDAQADWDAADKLPTNLRIEAPYVIVQGLTLRNAQRDGIQLGDVQHVVIEDCDISGWGRNANDEPYGQNFDAAISSRSDKLEQVVIQRCRLHDPRSDSNSWKEKRVRGSYHPAGPQAIVFHGGKGRYVIRHNRIDSTLDHMYNDSMGEWRNFSFAGFPNRDSDIYDNYVSHCWDDGIEIEGANMNVRVWHNYLTMTYGAIGDASTSLGPVYVFRNVYAVSRKSEGTDKNSYRGHYLIKLGADPRNAKYSMGRKYFLHNTILQPPSVGGEDPTSGAQSGMALTSTKKIELNIVSRNNILYMRHAYDWAIRDPQRSPKNDFDYDLYNGRVQAADGAESRGVQGIPQFEQSPDGRLWLKPGSPGFDAGQRLANFNDDFSGEAPDMGAVETGTAQPKPAMWPTFPAQPPIEPPAGE